MTRKELESFINQGEGYHLEFKESVNSGLAKELSAFANSKGGKVLIGVKDSGEIMTTSLNNSLRSRIQDIARECDPSISINVELIDDMDSVLVVNVPEGKNKPYRCSTGFYVREGASSNKRNTQEIFDLFNDAGKFSFDDRLMPEVDFKENFSSELLDLFLVNSRKEKLLSNEETLCNFGVAEMIEGKCVLNSTGVLLFCNKPAKYIKNSVIQCVRFNGNEKVDILDKQDLSGDLISNIFDCVAFLQKHLNVGYEISDDDLRRRDKWEIPLRALREALVNAIVHRDYLEKGTYIQVLVFDSTVSIINYGGLGSNMKIEDLGKRTFRRNPNIADMFGKTELSEKMGSGIHRIIKSLKDAGLPEAVFEVDENWFTVTFSRHSKESKKNVNIVLGQELSDLQKIVLEFCIEPKSRVEIFNKIDLSNQSKNFKSHIEPLIENGFLAMTIPDKVRSQNQKYYTVVTK